MTRRPKGTGSVKESTPGVWRVRVYIGLDPLTGRPRQVERTVHGGRAAAETVRRRLEVEVGEGKYVGTHGTVEHLLAVWIAHGETVDGRAPLTVRQRRQVARKHLIPALGAKPVNRVTTEDLDSYYRSKMASGLAGSTVRMHHQVLTAAFSQAVKWEWIVRNPAANATPPRAGSSDRLAPSTEQIRALIIAANDDADLGTAVMLGATTGCRRGELVGLQWRDVDFDTGKLRVERQRYPGGKGGDITGPPKSKQGKRVISLDPLAVAVLRRYRLIQEARAEKIGITIKPSGWLLSPDCGVSPIPANSLGQRIRRLGVRAGVPVTTHLLRYYAATMLVGDGVDPVTAAQRMGHDPALMMRTYANFLPSKDVSAAELLGRHVLGPVEEEK